MPAFIDLELRAKNLLSNPVKTATKDSEALAGELTELEQAIIDMANAQKVIAKENALQDSLKETNNAIKNSRAEFDELETSYKKVAGPALELSKNIAAGERAIESSNKSYKQTATNLEEVQKNLKKAGASSRDLVAEQSDLTAKTKLLNGELTKTDNALKQLAKAKSLEAQLNKDAQAVEKTEKALAGLRAEIAASDAPSQSFNKSLKAQEKALKEANSAYSKSEKNLNKYKTELSTMGIEVDKISEAETKLTAIRKQSSTELNGLKDKLKSVADLQKDLAKSNLYEKSLTDLNSKLVDQKKILADLKTQYENTGKPAKELQQSYDAAQKKLATYLSKQEKLKLQLAENAHALKRAGVETDDLAAADKRLSVQKINLINKLKAEKAALDKVNKAKVSSASNTDLLTQATRRLAQMYTVIIAAEKSIGAVKHSVEGYSDLEDAVTKVEKTTSNARQQIEAMTEQLQVMATEVTPTATKELLGYGEVAGQLGVKSTEDIMNIVAAADALAVSTNLAGDEAVTMLARILTMTDQDVGKYINNISSVLVELGNNYAATEAEITHFTQEMVTGTRVIDLSAQASAAFGATLKESGQAAERSRSAMFEMSQMIKKASVEGGQDLQSLIDVTGMTAEAIEQNLKDKPEAVLLAFVKGLNRVKVEGGLVSGTLADFGIQGKEATSVIEILADKHVRLEQALNMSNDAFIKGNAHLDEATKSYANQSAELQRLLNQFEELATAVGEAYSDDVKQGIDGASRALEEQAPYVVELSQLMADFGRGVVQTMDDISDLFSALAGDTNVGVIMKAFMALKNTFNQITSAAKAMYLVLQKIGFMIGMVFGATDEQLAIAAKNIEKTTASIKEDIEDMATAQAIFDGTSSYSYESLKKTVEQYSATVATLSEREQLRIKGLLREGAYMADNNSLYNEITASIIRQVRESEVQEAQQEQALLATQKRLLAEKASAKAAEEKQQALARMMLVIGDNAEHVTEKTNHLNQAREFGIITELEYADSMALVNEAQQKHNQIATDAIVKKQQAVSETKQLINITRAMSDEVVNVALSINKEETALNKLKVVLVGLKQDQELYKETILEIEKVEARIAEKKATMAVIQELEGKKIFELTQMQAAHELVLKRLHSQYSSGLITFGEYQASLDAEKVKTDLLNEAVGTSTERVKNKTKAVRELKDALNENTNSNVDNTNATKSNTSATDENTKAVNSVGSATSLAAEAQAWLTKEFDFSSHSLEALTARYDELQRKITQTTQITNVWYKEIGKTFAESFRREQRLISETKTFRKYSEQIESGTLSIAQLDAVSRDAQYTLRHLNESDLSSLHNAIDAAREKMLALQQTAKSALVSVQDELDRMNDNLADVEQRQAEERLKELEAQLATAKATRNRQAILDLEKAISLTKTLNKQKLDAIKLEKIQRLENEKIQSAENKQSNSDLPTATQTPQSPSTTTETITVILKSGQRSVPVTTDSSNKTELIDLIEEAGFTS